MRKLKVKIQNLKLCIVIFFDYNKIFDTKYELYTKLSDELQFINYTTPFEQIRANFSKLKPLEKKLKSEIRELLKDNLYQTEFTEEIIENFELYLSKDWKYFGNEKYFNDNLEILFTALNNYVFLLSRGYFLLKKKNT